MRKRAGFHIFPLYKLEALFCGETVGTYSYRVENESDTEREPLSE